jgi:SagB-type dehydrogenase family enzyme
MDFPMKYCATNTIIALPAEQGVILYDYTSKSAGQFPSEALHWLHYFATWRETGEAISSHPQMSEEYIRAMIEALAELGYLYTENDPKAAFQKEFEQSWTWGHAAAMFHFSVLNNPFHSAAESQQMQIEKLEKTPSPILYWRNTEQPLELDATTETNINSLISVMEKRRTNRVCLRHGIDKSQLADCLRSGLGITGFVETETGYLPLTMTPSGGARNPFEAYVLVRDVEGISPGFYHYSAIDHTLQITCTDLPNQQSNLLAGQEWVDEMPVIVFLVAAMERTMWKYPDANAYRVVLIEAGHIGQNMMLAATAHGLSCCPTAALCHDSIGRYLNLEKITHVPIYALTLGVPGAYDAKIISRQEYQKSLETNYVA